MKKVTKTKLLVFVLCAVLVLVFGQGKAGLAWSESDCTLNLPPICLDPPSAVQVTNLYTNELEACADILDPSNRSYFETTIEVPDDGFSIDDGTFDGWCVDLEGEVLQNDSFGVNLISSLDAPTVPEITRDITETQWNQINCILNDETVDRNWLDEQAAYWTIFEGSFPGNFPFGDNQPDGCSAPNKPDQDVVDDLLALADTEFCKNFKPTAGQVVAVVVQPLLPETCDPDPYKQVNIIELGCPGEGCTPGYWKQPQHFDSWPAPFTPDTLFSDVFEDAFPGMTLLDVLRQGGGGLKALGRHTVAALLNAASSGVSYDLTEDEVIDGFNDVFPGGDFENLKDIFEGFNKQGCPLD